MGWSDTRRFPGYTCNVVPLPCEITWCLFLRAHTPIRHIQAMSASTATETQTSPSQNRNRRGSRGRGGRRSGPDTTKAAQRSGDKRTPAPPTTTHDPTTTSNVTNDDQDTTPAICWICAEPVKYYSLSACNHRTCHVCALRLRALYKKLACTFCKVRRPASTLRRLIVPSGAPIDGHIHHLARRRLCILHARLDPVQRPQARRLFRDRGHDGGNAHPPPIQLSRRRM